MKTITIQQPFATLIAKGYKLYEFRTWKTKYRGDLLIHAGKGVDKLAMKKFEFLNLEYPSGVIVAKAKLTDCISVNENFRKQLKKENNSIYSNIIKDTDWHGYGFKLENIVEIDPVNINGKLSFWEYEGEINEKKSESRN